MDAIDKYLALYQARPALFLQSELLKIIIDEQEIRAFQQKSGKVMGLVFDNSPFFIVVCDLVEDKKGKQFAYARVIYINDSTGGVAIPVLQSGQIGLIRIFRHAHRKSYWELPRGFGSKGLSAEENIAKELSEELQAENVRVRRIGTVAPDSGLCNATVAVFEAAISSAHIDIGCEGITKLVFFTQEEIEKMILAGEITDGFTVSALHLRKLAASDNRRGRDYAEKT